MTHIHLLANDFRDDKTPNMLIQNRLNYMADTRIMKFMGANVERKAKYTDYSLTDMFDQKIQ